MKATHSGTRRSTKRTMSPEARAKAAENLAKARAARGGKGVDGLHPEEDPRFPGYHTCVVPKKDPRDPRAASPIGAYKGQGYKELSTDPLHSGHEEEIVMGIPIDVYLKREEARMEYHNGLLQNLMPENMDMAEEPGENAEIFFERSESGLKVGPKISLAEAGASMGTTNSALPDASGD